MITYLPEIYPDELVYSWFCRYYVHSGCLTHKMAMEDILYKRCNNPSKEFLGHLQPDLLEKIQTMFPTEKLILEHTMFPQYARFIPLRQKKNALYHLAHDFCDVHHLFSILPRSDADRNMKYCPLCAEEDRKVYGETYWHRIHQIRNLQICPVHECMLILSEVTAKSEQTFTFCPAEEYTIKHDIKFADNTSSPAFAKYLADVFGTPFDLENEIPISTVLYYAMMDSPYLNISGKTRYIKRLVDDMHAFYETIGIYNTASFYQIQRTLLDTRYDFSVVCQIAYFLGISVDALTKPITTEEQIQAERETHSRKQKPPVNWIAYDNALVPVLQKTAQEIYDGTASTVGRPERVSERLICRKLNLQTHQLGNLPRCKAIFEQYAESYPESWARRILWAYRKLQTEKRTQIFWSDIRELSGVKKKNFDAAALYLVKYADKAVAENIIEIVKGTE